VVGDLLDPYEIGASWDEMFACGGAPRPSYLPLYQVLRALSSSDLDERCVARDRSFRDQGITFSLSGRGGARDRTFRSGGGGPDGGRLGARPAALRDRRHRRYDSG
jgi:hypothetical protein